MERTEEEEEKDQRAIQAVREVEHAAAVSIAAGGCPPIDLPVWEKEAKDYGHWPRSPTFCWTGSGAAQPFAGPGAALPKTENDEDIPAEEIEHKTTNCLSRAAKLVCGERAAAYGPPTHSLEQVGRAWAAYLVAKQGPLDGRDVANMMMIYKCIRDRYSRKQDNMDDIAGYAQVASWIGDPRV